MRGESGTPVIIETKPGYILSRPINKDDNISSTIVSHLLKSVTKFIDNDTLLNEKLQKFWEVQAVGVHKEDMIYKNFKNEISFNEHEQRYQVRFPLKDEHDFLPDNYSHCLQRVKGLKTRLSHDPQLLQSYKETVQKHQERPPKIPSRQ